MPDLPLALRPCLPLEGLRLECHIAALLGVRFADRADLGQIRFELRVAGNSAEAIRMSTSCKSSPAPSNTLSMSSEITAPFFFARLRCSLKEEGDRHLEKLREMLETTCRDAVCAFFVFLNLLEGEAERVGERFLVHAQQQTTHPNPASDMHVDRIGHTGAAPVFRRLLRLLHFAR